MIHIVFLVGTFHPNFSAVGYCAYQVQKCLTNSFKVTTIAVRNSDDQKQHEVIENIEIYHVDTSSIKRRRYIELKKGSVGRLRLLALRINSALRKVFAHSSVDDDLVKSYLEQLNSLPKPPDAIVAVILPIEAAIATVLYSAANPKVKVIPYWFDKFAASNSLHVWKLSKLLKRKLHVQIEEKILSSSNLTVAMHPLKGYFEANFEKDLTKKVRYVEHPLLKEIPSGSEAIDNNEIRMCFTGSLIKGYVEVDYLLRLLKKIKASKFVNVDFYVTGNGATKVIDHTIDGRVSIFNHGRVAKAEANAAMIASDFLINIGEISGSQISSKVFEYMSTGKPIIHLGYVKDDIVSRILEKYPLALSIVQDETTFADNCAAVSFFINSTSTQRIAFEDVKSLYPEALPETTASLIADVLR